MAQTVKTPRFWINELEWQDFNGVASVPHKVFRTLPVSQTTLSSNGYTLNIKNDLNNPFCFVLGHECSSITISGVSPTAEINGSPFQNGWSLFTFSGNPTKITTSNSSVGSILIGSYWDAVSSPDLNLTMSYEYSGIKTIETKGGSTLTNSNYHKNPMWGQDLAAWELSSSQSQGLSRSGRRVWDIQFSFVSSSNLMPTSLNLINENGTTTNTLSEGTDFYSEVINKTAGGSIPFIFSPDSTSTALDNFAICTIPQNSISFQQTAFNMYSVKLKVREAF